MIGAHRMARVGIAAVFVFFVAEVKEAHACSCPSPGPACRAAWSVDAVFSGTVQSITEGEVQLDASGSPWRVAVVRLQVMQMFVGAPQRSVEIAINPLSSCSFGFTVGGQYLVYANRSKDGRLTTSNCTRTRRLSESREDLQYLSALPPLGTTHRIYGRVNESRRHPAEAETIDYGPVEHLTVSVRGSTWARDLVTDAHGRFDLAGLPAGNVTVTLLAPAGYRAWPSVQEFELRESRACYIADFTITPFAQVSGVVLNAEGRPVAGIDVEAVAAELAGFDPSPSQTAVRTDHRGVFEFDNLPPGTYVFGLNLTKPPFGPRRGTPIYLPGTSAPRDAAIFELKIGDRRDVGALRLKP